MRGLVWQCSPRDAIWCHSQDQHHSLIHFLSTSVLCQSYPSASEERAARWVGFGDHVGDALTHKLLDDDTQKILYRSAVRPLDSTHPNRHLVPGGWESSQTHKPIV